jgi:ribonuclease VapC
VILDTSALVAILFREPERPHFIELMADADRLRLSAASVVELTVVLSKEFGAAAAAECDRFLSESDISVKSGSLDLARIAGEAFLKFGKGRHPAGLNFGDCFSYALAKATGEPLLFKGEDFRKTDLNAAY